MAQTRLSSSVRLPPTRIAGRVSELLRCEVLALKSCDAALGCALIAEDVYKGAREVLGLRVDGWVG